MYLKQRKVVYSNYIFSMPYAIWWALVVSLCDKNALWIDRSTCRQFLHAVEYFEANDVYMNTKAHSYILMGVQVQANLVTWWMLIVFGLFTLCIH